MARWFRTLCAGLLIPAMMLSCGSFSVSVQASAPLAAAAADSVLSAEPSNNLSDHNYTPWSSVIKSYLHETSDGTLERVEWCSNHVAVERFAADDGAILSSQKITPPLPLFGGAFFGAEYNFLVFGQKNENDDPNVEVIRIQKYTKDWTLLGSAPIYGANTNEPFWAGSLRMEEYGGKLFVHTCHSMFATEDGVHHQANMVLLCDEASMQIVQSFSGISMIQYTGYVSHSFNQFVRSDGTYLFRVDHGDARPRAITLVRSLCEGSITDVSYCLPLELAGENGQNYTDATVGGLELTDNACLIAGTYKRPGTEKAANNLPQYNIFVTVTGKDLGSTSINWITQYQPDEKITPGTPYLVKLGSDRFLLMWEERLSETSEYRTRMTLLDASGTAISPAYTTPYRLSDCEPCLCSDGMVRWYVTANSTPQFYSVDPRHLSDITAENEDGFDWDYDETTRVLTVRSMPVFPPKEYPWSELGSVRSLVIEEGVSSIPADAFRSMRFSDVQLPDSLRAIGASAFWNCSELKTLTIPPDVSIIGNNAFEYCRKLETVELPPALTVLPQSLFSNCSALKEITIPEGVTNLPFGVLSYCESLERLYLPAKVTSVYWNVFRDCEKLTDVYFGGTQAQWDAIQIGSDNDPLTDATLHLQSQGLPVVEPETEPTTETMLPPTTVTEPSTEATEPSTDETESSTDATEPSTDETEPSTDATEPSTNATEPVTDMTEARSLPTVDVWNSLLCISLDSNAFTPEDFIRSAVIDDQSADMTKFSIGTTMHGAEEGLTPAKLFDPAAMADGIQRETLYLYYDGTYVPETELHVLIGVKGDANADGKTDAADATSVLIYAAQRGAGLSAALTDGRDAATEQFRLYMADIDYNSETGFLVDASDAASILLYAAKTGAGEEGTW